MQVYVQEIIPSLIKMLYRPLRAIVSQLFTAEEKSSMQSLISMLITYNFTFDLAPMEAAEDTAPLLLKPEIHRICSFPVSHLRFSFHPQHTFVLLLTPSYLGLAC